MKRVTTSILDKNERGDRPTGAGAAPGRQDLQPRAGSQRGSQDTRSTKFYAHLAQMPHPGITSAGGKFLSGYPATAQIIVRGEFVGSARWITCASAPEARQQNLEPERPSAPVGIAAEGEDPTEPNSDLGLLLAAITDDVQGRAAAARDGVRADFAGRITYARKHLSPDQRAAALRALVEARKTALALINQSAALELAGRKKAALGRFGGKSHARRTDRRSTLQNVPHEQRPKP
jgi:hypothetical protein